MRLHPVHSLVISALASVTLGIAWPMPLAAQTPAPRASSGPLPRTKADAEKWLREHNQGTGPDALAFYLALGSNWSADVVRMMLLGGASATAPDHTGEYPMNALAISCDGQAAAAEIGEVLLQAGAAVDKVESGARKATPAMAAVMCPALLKVILSKKPNLNALDANNMTAMDYAIRYGKPREEVMRLMIDSGFDMQHWRGSLLDNYSDTIDKLIESMSPGTPPVATRSTPARAVVARPEAPRPSVAIDWKAAGPYPPRTAVEARRLLARPGADLTANDHFWDAVNHLEPQRLSLAIQAGAIVRQTNTANNYTPLMTLADSCDPKRDVEAQIAIADQLIAAGADAKFVHPDGWTALIIAADDCPLPVVQALVNAGVPLNAVQRSGNTPLKDGNTALKLAILRGRADVVDLLLDAGVDPKKEPYNAGRLASADKAVEAALKKKRK